MQQKPKKYAMHLCIKTIFMHLKKFYATIFTYKIFRIFIRILLFLLILFKINIILDTI